MWTPSLTPRLSIWASLGTRLEDTPLYKAHFTESQMHSLVQIDPSIKDKNSFPNGNYHYRGVPLYAPIHVHVEYKLYVTLVICDKSGIQIFAS